MNNSKATEHPCQTKSFYQAFFGDVRGLALLVVVCTVISLGTNALNQLGWLPNLLFSFSYGFPISIIETYFRVRRNPPSEMFINISSLFLGSLIGSAVVYGYLLYHDIANWGEMNGMLIFHFGFGLSISAVAFYFFWSQYRNQMLTLALREQQLKAAELENLKRQAENQLLQSQMEPHFLFNTLANIQSLIDIDTKAAKDMLANLSNMLRASLKNSENTYCTLAQELALVSTYLNIQAVRMGDKIKFVQQIDDETLSIKILPMLLQPIIENSVRHGVEKSKTPCTLNIRAHVDNEKLYLVVSDDCPAQSSTSPSTGISLKNIRKRLANCYGEQASFTSEATEPGWRTEILLPIEIDETP